MNIKEAKQILNENGYHLVEAVSYLGQAKQIAQRLGYFAFIDKEGTLVIHDDKSNIAEIDNIDYTKVDIYQNQKFKTKQKYEIQTLL